MSKKLTMPSLAMLPLEDMKKEMAKDFQLKGEASQDTERVAGVDADLIAVSCDPNLPSDAEILDRETVKNAVFLGGKHWMDYISKDQGDALTALGENVAEMVTDEMAALRDELYQLKAELVKRGYVKDTGVYSGFQDLFQEGFIQYFNETLGIVVNQIVNGTINSIEIKKTDAVSVGEWIVIEAGSVKHLVKITNIEASGAGLENIKITFTSPHFSGGIDATNVPGAEVKKTHGIYRNGTFSFTTVKKNAATTQERFTMLNDDSVPNHLEIRASNSGFATSFKTPNRWFAGEPVCKLNYFKAYVKQEGMPGDLICHIVEEDRITEIRDLSDVMNQGVIFASSKPISPTAEMTRFTEVTFDFDSDVRLENKRYIFIVMAIGASTEKKWFVEFGKGLESDLQTNNNSYIYTGTGLVADRTIGDMIFTLSTSEILAELEMPNAEGVYSSKVVPVQYNKNIARARVTLRVAREGILTTGDTTKVVNAGGAISIDPTYKDDKNHLNPTAYGYGIKSGDKVIIGSQIRTVTQDASSLGFSVDDVTIIKAFEPIYRAGYEVNVKAVKKQLIGTEERIIDVVTIPLELKAIMTGNRVNESAVSDRLVYEAEFRDEESQLIMDHADEVYIQIKWGSNLDVGILDTYKDYWGRIHELTASFDRTI